MQTGSGRVALGRARPLPLTEHIQPSTFSAETSDEVAPSIPLPIVGATVVVVLTIALDAAGLNNADPGCVVAEPEPSTDPGPSTVVATPPPVAGSRLFRCDLAIAPETARERGEANPVTAVVGFERPERRSSLEDAAPGIDPATVPDPDPGSDAGEMDPPSFAIVREMDGVVDLVPAALPALGVMDARERAVASAAIGAESAT